MNSSDLPIKYLKSKFPQEIPDAYIKGYVEFYKLKFKVTPDVLIPRPETELLVDEVLNYTRNEPLTILDIGTGAGSIAVSVAKNLIGSSKPRIFAIEVSRPALEIAKENARKNRVQDKIFFLESDLLGNINANTKVDVIVTNLPYIPTSRIPYLHPSVKDFEPSIALDGGYDGFGLYRKLFAQMKDKNIIPKLLIGEMDYTQGELSVLEAQKYFPKAEVEVKTDLAHKQRILLIRF